MKVYVSNEGTYTQGYGEVGDYGGMDLKVGDLVAVQNGEFPYVDVVVKNSIHSTIGELKEEIYKYKVRKILSYNLVTNEILKEVGSKFRIL